MSPRRNAQREQRRCEEMKTKKVLNQHLKTFILLVLSIRLTSGCESRHFLSQVLEGPPPTQEGCSLAFRKQPFAWEWHSGAIWKWSYSGASSGATCQTPLHQQQKQQGKKDLQLFPPQFPSKVHANTSPCPCRDQQLHSTEATKGMQSHATQAPLKSSYSQKTTTQKPQC